MNRIWDLSIEVCICTYRRASLIDTLRSLDGSKADLPVSVLVIDNDATASARMVAKGFAATSDLPVRYVHCPGANISVARNAALEHSHARYLAFLDDDETAAPNWVSSLKRTMSETDAVVVLGPVRAVYSDHDPVWMQTADPHSTTPVFVKGEIKTGYSCNVLIDRLSAVFDGLEFPLELGRTGGEDTAFFTEAFQRGGKIAFASDAIVYEAVPPERACFGWLAKRRYRMGQTHGRLLLGAGSWPAVRSASVALGKVVICASVALFTCIDPVKRNKAVLRGCLHAGTLSAHLGLSTLELYGKNNKGAMP